MPRTHPPRTRWLARVAALALATCVPTAAQDLSPAQLQQVVARLADGATHSWELGTRAQALLELNAPRFSVFANASLPPPPAPGAADDLSDVLAIARATVAQLPNTTAPQPLVAGDGAAGDPASLGVAVLLANWTAAPAPPGAGFAAAAQAQLQFLLADVPRTPDGAISHRRSQVQLWSDSVYMVPPFLAYFGALTQNATLLATAYAQIALYRTYLRDPGNLWRHIALGNGTDPGHWSTGNAWAAAGILRVLATLLHVPASALPVPGAPADLAAWATEILDAAFAYQNSAELVPNYADDATAFPDAAATALLAACAYRLAVLAAANPALAPRPARPFRNVPAAERARHALAASHIDADGWLAPVVNPENVSQQGAHSPEAQAFVVEMQAAWRDWGAAGEPGKNAARRGRGAPGMGALGWGVAAAAAAWGVVW